MSDEIASQPLAAAASTAEPRRTHHSRARKARHEERKSPRMKQEMLINVAQPEECRIAIVEDGQLEELYLERSSQSNYVGNIYKGRIVNLEPSIQAAFVDFGVGRNGFLHISDVEPQYFRQGGYDPRKALLPNGGQSRDRDFDRPEHGDDEGPDDRGDDRGEGR